MLTFSATHLRRGNRELLSGATFAIHAGQRVGITGANGVGKSSLFAVILGKLGVDGGEFSIPPDWTIAHVAQQTPAGDLSALDYVLEGDGEYTTIMAALEQAEGLTLAQLHSRLEAIDGYRAKSRAAALLSGLGFPPPDIKRPVDSFSGGWRMRLNLAQALMCRSDLLLLDEPTNHLDLDTVIWLQSWLARYQGTLLLISHDREFLDAITDHIAHFENQNLTLYKGNYSAFEKQRAAQLAQQHSSYLKQKREIAHMQQFVARFRAKATKARQAQSRLKALQRLQSIAPAHIASPFRFAFPAPDRLPDRLLHASEISVGYNDKPILKNIDIQLLAGDRIGLIGPNGAGKSTLMRCLAGELQLQGGEWWQSQHLCVGYFAQHQLEQLHPEQTPLQHLLALNSGAVEQTLRDYLGGYGFSGEQMEQPVQPFSGGEKARLVLALLIFLKPNLLLLDEPTNHLDLEMRHALCVALQEYAGAMVIVSHDRHLLRTVTDRLLLVHESQITPYDGDLDSYAYWLQKHNSEPQLETESNDSSANRKVQRRLDAERRIQLRPFKERVTQLDSELERLHAEQDAMQAQLADQALYEPNTDSALPVRLNRQLSELLRQLETTEQQWLEAAENYEAAKERLMSEGG